MGVDYASLADRSLQQCITDSGIEFCEQLQTLHCSHSNVASVEGLQQFKQLTVVSLNNNRINSLEPLTGMSQLYYLDISHNRVAQLPQWGKNTHNTKPPPRNNPAAPKKKSKDRENTK